MTRLGEWYWQDLATVGSTNDAAALLSRNPPAQKCVVSAREQTAGRGRRGRSWLSLPGNLFMSLLLPGTLQDMNFLPFAVSLSLFKTIKQLSPELEVGLKWPNDVLVRGAKVSGILLEKTENPYIIIGIGVNLAASPRGDKNLLYPVIGLGDCGIKIDRCSFLKLYLRQFDETMALLERQGFAPVREQWLQQALNLGREITVHMENTAFEGIFKGLSESGALLLERNGRIEKIYAGDVFIKKENKD